MPRPADRGLRCSFGWLRGIRTTYDKVPATTESSVQTERSVMRVLRRTPRAPTASGGAAAPGAVPLRPEEMLAQQSYSAPEFRARLAAAKLMNILWAKEPSQVHLDQSLYGAAFVLPQIARSAGWPRELKVLCLKTYLVLLCNYVVQFAILYFIAKENMVWDLFSGQMFLCDFGKDAASCPDGPNCIGPGGTVFTNSRYYSWSQWSARTYTRDSLKTLFPDELPDIAKYADPGEYGIESNTCRMVCCMLFVVTVLGDLLGSFNLAWLMANVESTDGLWIDWDPPKAAWASKEHAKMVMNCDETAFVKLKVEGMPLHWKLLNCLLILLPKLFLWKVTTEAGIVFLMETQGIEDLVVNSVALAFILQIDELLCSELMNAKVIELLRRMEIHYSGDVAFIDEVERLTDQELFERNQQEIFEPWNLRDLWKLVPVKLVLTLFITWFFVMRYYWANCVQSEAGGLVSKSMRLPLHDRLSLASAYLSNIYPIPSEEKFFWSMPSVAASYHPN